MKVFAHRAEAVVRAEGLPWCQGCARLGVWLLLLAFTAVLLVYPTRLTLQHEAIQSLSAIDNLPLFAGVYSGWLLSLLLLLFSGGEGARWERPALVGIFTLVFVGLWLLAGPNTALRNDGVGNAAHVGYLSRQAGGKIRTDHANLFYFNFPGMHLLALALVEVTGLGLSQGVTLALAFHLVLLSVLLYIVFLRSLRSPSLAAFGALLAIQGNIMLGKYSFYPSIWALVFLAMFLVLLQRPGRALCDTWEDGRLMLFLLGATTITHLVTAMLLFFVLVGIYLVRNCHLLRTKMGSGLVSASTLAAFLVIPLSWDIYWATRIFEGLTRVTAAVVGDLSERGLLTYFAHLRSAYVGAGVPVWAILVRCFWWVALFLFGPVLGLKNLLNIKALSRAQQVDTGGLVGVVVLSAAVSLLSVGGAEFYRFLLYGAFFTVPILLSFVVNLPAKGRRLALGLGIPLFFLLSFPTFLAHNNLVGTSTYYPAELRAGSFLEQASGGQGKGLTVFNDPVENGLLSYSIPDATLIATPQASELKGKEDFWQAAAKSVRSFSAWQAAGEQSPVFYLSQRRIALAEHLLRVRPQDSGWGELRNTLGETSKVYENGLVQIYTSIYEQGARL
jgi:hypothetical protein